MEPSAVTSQSPLDKPVWATSFVTETTGAGLNARLREILAVSPLEKDFVSVPAVTDGMSSAVAPTKIVAAPDKLMAAPALELSLTVRVMAVPEAL